MQRIDNLKKFDIKTRNKIRSILSDKEKNAISQLSKLCTTLQSNQIETLNEILKSSYLAKAVKRLNPFPKKPQFHDTLHINRVNDLQVTLNKIEKLTEEYKSRLQRLTKSLYYIDYLYSQNKNDECLDKIIEVIKDDGWSHAVLRKLVLLRESKYKSDSNDRIENLVNEAGIKGVVVSTLIHTFAKDQNFLMSKRSVLNIPDRGVVNSYTRTISKIAVQPLAISTSDLSSYLNEVIKCSLIDAIIIAKFNKSYFNIENYPNINLICKELGKCDLFQPLIKTYDASSQESEYLFYKQSSAWLEYEAVENYRFLIDNYYDSTKDEVISLHPEIKIKLKDWVGDAQVHSLVSGKQFTKHPYEVLSNLETCSFVSRSAVLNYWLTETEGQIGFEKEELFTLMGITRDLARTIPVSPTRTAARIAQDELVKLIFLLLLSKRSKNELDSFHLRKSIENISLKNHNGSLVDLVKSYEKTHPYVSEYIYDIATEDFLAKLTKLAPHRSDIPEIRASLHEWMAKFTGDDYYLGRARAVRIDHQINRVRNEIDDHRIYVDPMRFMSWIEDEMMLEINSALSSSGSGKKGVAVTCDETVLSMVVTQSYNAFCSNPVFGIASYIGRRIRHGTFHGHMYSSIINSLEKADKYKPLFESQSFQSKWSLWKENYNEAVELIIAERLHVHSKSKPYGLMTPEVYSPVKQDVLSVAVTNIVKNYSETISTTDIFPTIVDFCWRLAELDLIPVVHYLKAQQNPLKNSAFLEEELCPSASMVNDKLADSFRRDLELAIDRKLSTMLGWFKRPSIVAPKASVSLLFSATVAEVKDSIPEFNPQNADHSDEEIELVGNFYHLIYDTLVIVVTNAAKHGDLKSPINRKFIVKTGKTKRLVIEISSSIKPYEDPCEVSRNIEARKIADFHDANLYDKKSGISKLLLLQSSRTDFNLEQYEVIGRQVKVRLSYALDY